MARKPKAPQAAPQAPAADPSPAAPPPAAKALPPGFDRPPEIERVVAAVAELNGAIKALGEAADRLGTMPEHLVFLTDVGSPGRPNLMWRHYQMRGAMYAYRIGAERLPIATVLPEGA